MTREEYAKLSDEEKRIKVAELCGWSEVKRRGNPPGIVTGYRGDGTEDYVPDYLNDLNAMHNVLETFKATQHWEFETILRELMEIRYWWNATAAQRTEAFVLTMDTSK